MKLLTCFRLYTLLYNLFRIFMLEAEPQYWQQKPSSFHQHISFHFNSWALQFPSSQAPRPCFSPYLSPLCQTIHLHSQHPHSKHTKTSSQTTTQAKPQTQKPPLSAHTVPKPPVHNSQSLVHDASNPTSPQSHPLSSSSSIHADASLCPNPRIYTATQ
jgi:hypothetical protein